MITIIAKFSVMAGKTDEFIKLANDVTRQTKKEKGNLSYKIFQSQDTATSFTFIEEWLNDLSIAEHNSTPHFKEFVEKVTPILEKDIEIEKLDKVPSVFF